MHASDFRKLSSAPNVRYTIYVVEHKTGSPIKMYRNCTKTDTGFDILGREDRQGTHFSLEKVFLTLQEAEASLKEYVTRRIGFFEEEIRKARFAIQRLSKRGPTEVVDVTATKALKSLPSQPEVQKHA